MKCQSLLVYLESSVKLKVPRFYCYHVETGRLELASAESHHLTHVLRLSPGDRIEVFNGRGVVGQGMISDITRKTATLTIESLQRTELRTAGRIVIAASIAKAQRFDWLITKCTELGADHIAAVLFERTVKHSTGAGAMERYNKLAISAAKQCGRIFLPKISPPASLAENIATLKNDYPQADILFGGFGEQAKPLVELSGTGSDVIAFIGPEGGLSNIEEKLLGEHRAREVRIVHNVLRVETAAIAFAAVLCAMRN